MGSEKEVVQKQLSSLREAVSKLIHRAISSLTVASGNTQIVAMRWKGKLAEEDLHQLKQVDERIQWAAGVFQRLMKFSKQMEEEMTALEIDEVVKEAVESFPEKFSLEQIQMQVQLNAGCKILANPKQLKETMVELLGNAYQAMEGKGKIVVKSERLDKKVQLLIEDTGTGIAPEVVRDKIFQSFYTTKNDHHGLGLYMSHLIVSIHGGAIQCESEVGKGTKLTIELPVLLD